MMGCNIAKILVNLTSPEIPGHISAFFESSFDTKIIEIDININCYVFNLRDLGYPFFF